MILKAVLILAMAVFFPIRPAHAPDYIENGTLASYGVGNAEGHLELRDERDARSTSTWAIQCVSTERS